MKSKSRGNGMNIQDVIKSGRPFRKKDEWCKDYFTLDQMTITFKGSSAGANGRWLEGEEFELKQEPRKVTLYQYLYENQDGDKYVSKETSASWEHSFDYCEKYELLKTFTREIEF